MREYAFTVYVVANDIGEASSILDANLIMGEDYDDQPYVSGFHPATRGENPFGFLFKPLPGRKSPE